MSVVTLTPQEIARNVAEVITMTASTTDGVEFVVPVGCERFVAVFNNTSADTAYDVTLKAPTNKTDGSAQADATAVEIAAAGVAALVVETARWMDASTRKVLVDSENAAITAAVLYF